MARSWWKRVLVIGVALVLVVWCTQLYRYWRTDRVYEELAAARPQTRAEVESKLDGFRGTPVSEPEKMQPILREKLGSGREYWRYAKYTGFAIDVVYEADGSVFSLWPGYE